MGKLTHSTILLQEFEFKIQHRPSAQHKVADYLSHIENEEEAVEGEEDFPDIGILCISASDAEEDTLSPNDKWLEDMSHFLTIGLTTPTNANKQKEVIGGQKSQLLLTRRYPIPQRKRRHLAKVCSAG